MIGFLPLFAGCGSVAILNAEDPAAGMASAVLAPKASKADWTVDCAGGGDFESIGDAIDAAASGDWIEVAPCTYQEQIDFGGKALWISSSDGPDTTIIDANNRGWVVQATHGEGDQTALVGFTLSGGSGGAVYVDYAALRLENIVLKDIRGEYGIYAASADLEIDGLTMDNVTASYAAIAGERGALQIVNSEVTCGRGYGVYSAHGSALVDWSTIDCSGGQATFWNHTTGRMQRTTVIGRTYVLHEDDHYDDAIKMENVYHKGSIEQTYGTFWFRNSMLDGGTATLNTVYEASIVQASVFQGASCAISSDALFDVSYSDFSGTSPDCTGVSTWVGSNGNIDDDPGFVNAAGGDWHLATGSALINAGLDGSADDVDGSRNDIGIYGGPRTLDGGW